ncbi:MAG: hypothetical protein WC869_00260 [Phycisphaerae bacterium]|jgi:hypothetical protein
MTEWQTERERLVVELESASTVLRRVVKTPEVWHRVRQSAQRALEQVEVAKQQLLEQEHPL